MPGYDFIEISTKKNIIKICSKPCMLYTISEDNVTCVTLDTQHCINGQHFVYKTAFVYKVVYVQLGVCTTAYTCNIVHSTVYSQNSVRTKMCMFNIVYKKHSVCTTPTLCCCSYKMFYGVYMYILSLHRGVTYTIKSHTDI